MPKYLLGPSAHAWRVDEQNADITRCDPALFGKVYRQRSARVAIPEMTSGLGLRSQQQLLVQ